MSALFEDGLSSAGQLFQSEDGLSSAGRTGMDQPIIQESARLAADLGLRGADSLYVAVASQLNLPLVTLDDEQSARAAPVIAVQPLYKQG